MTITRTNLNSCLWIYGLALFAVMCAPVYAQEEQGRPKYRIDPRIGPRLDSGSRGGGITGKKIIEWGFDQPDTAMMRANIARMEQEPFDGVIFAAFGLDSKKHALDLPRNCWGHTAFTREQFANVVADLKATHFTKFTDNFLRLNVTPGDVDWFDDDGWGKICQNANLASWICSQAGLKGIMFDTEQYSTKPFSYNDAPGHNQHSFDAYRDQARKRGREFGAQLTAEKLDPTILLTFTDTIQILGDTGPLRSASQGLLPSFIDGLLEGANPRAQFVDANEYAYGAQDRAALTRLQKTTRDAARFSATPRAYSARMSSAFGLWLDKDWPKRGWDPKSVVKNYYQPDAFEQVVRTALELTDKYVWIYSEEMNWWTGSRINPLYTQAVENARRPTNQPGRR